MLNILFIIACFAIVTGCAEIVAHFRQKVVKFKPYSRRVRRKAMNGNSRGMLQDGTIIVGNKSHLMNAKGRKIGRNEPCPCGSGIKSKKCCNESHLSL